MLTALETFDAALAPGTPLLVRFEGTAESQAYDLARWVSDADGVDERMLSRCDGPTVDLGCGPGRLVAALGRRGVPALGVDLAPAAVRLACARGAVAVHGDLFAPLPGEGRWAWALLADGNIGIGGDPARLLRRVRGLVAPGGHAVVEVRTDEWERRGPARIRAGSGRWSGPFGWAVTGAAGVRRHANPTGWDVAEQWDDDGRRFVTLTAGARG